jgi:hypothetical protein
MSSVDCTVVSLELVRISVFFLYAAVAGLLAECASLLERSGSAGKGKRVLPCTALTLLDGGGKQQQEPVQLSNTQLSLGHNRCRKTKGRTADIVFKTASVSVYVATNPGSGFVLRANPTMPVDCRERER